MKRLLTSAAAALMFAACSRAESAHKGWATSPAQWPGVLSANEVVRHVGLAGPWVHIREPDPPPNGAFRGGYSFRTGSVVTVQQVYMLVANEKGAIKTRKLKSTPPVVGKGEPAEGYSYASFSTKKVSFKEGDVLVVVFKANGRTIPVFLKVYYNPFVPS